MNQCNTGQKIVIAMCIVILLCTFFGIIALKAAMLIRIWPLILVFCVLFGAGGIVLLADGDKPSKE